MRHGRTVSRLEEDPVSTEISVCVGIDVGKTNFHVIGLDAQGAVSMRGKHQRAGILSALVQSNAHRFAMEACGGAHELARRLRDAGREVRLIVPADVRPFVRTQKNDYNDAQAIAEASLRATVRTVPIKSVEQQDVQLMHRARQRLVRQRTAVINQLRAMLLEAGLTAGRGRKVLRRELPLLLEDADNGLSTRRRALIASWREEWRQQPGHPQCVEWGQVLNLESINDHRDTHNVAGCPERDSWHRQQKKWQRHLNNLSGATTGTPTIPQMSYLTNRQFPTATTGTPTICRDAQSAKSGISNR